MQRTMKLLSQVILCQILIFGPLPVRADIVSTYLNEYDFVEFRSQNSTNSRILSDTPGTVTVHSRWHQESPPLRVSVLTLEREDKFGQLEKICVSQAYLHLGEINATIELSFEDGLEFEVHSKKFSVVASARRQHAVNIDGVCEPLSIATFLEADGAAKLYFGDLGQPSYSVNARGFRYDFFPFSSSAPLVLSVDKTTDGKSGMPQYRARDLAEKLFNHLNRHASSVRIWQDDLPKNASPPIGSKMELY
ncbi:MAG: hypothetical protein AB7P04_00635 [Bacteriovoracia bacterium]